MFYSENVGSIRKGQGEDSTFFWLLPNFLDGYSYEKEEYCICSPLFSYHNSQWRLMVIKHDRNITSRSRPFTPTNFQFSFTQPPEDICTTPVEDLAGCNTLKPTEVATSQPAFSFGQPDNQLKIKQPTQPIQVATNQLGFSFGHTDNLPEIESLTTQPVRAATTYSGFSFFQPANQSKKEPHETQPIKDVTPELSFRSTLQHKKTSKSRKEQFGLFLWNTFSSDSNYYYNVCLKLSGSVSSCEGELDSDGCFGKWNFFNREDIQAKEVISVNGFLKIVCKIQLIEDIRIDEFIIEADVKEEPDDVEESKDEVIHDISETKGVDRLVKNLKDLLLDGYKSDVVLKVEQREFRVHKAILAARSPVFASMFQHEMAEKDSAKVNIPDCTPESFDVFLLYIYTGSASTISCDTVYNLYYVADKYHVEDLKEVCVEYMMANLSVDSFCDTIALSLQHSESTLQKEAVCFFCKNIKKIIKTVQWQKYLKENSTYANELFIKALNA